MPTINQHRACSHKGLLGYADGHSFSYGPTIFNLRNTNVDSKLMGIFEMGSRSLSSLPDTATSNVDCLAHANSFRVFLTQNMLLSSLIGFGLMVFQGNIARIFDNLNLFPALTYTQDIAFTSFWTTSQSAEKIWAYLWPCFATIAFWSLISYVFFLARPLRFDVR